MKILHAVLHRVTINNIDNILANYHRQQKQNELGKVLFLTSARDNWYVFVYEYGTGYLRGYIIWKGQMSIASRWLSDGTNQLSTSCCCDIYSWTQPLKAALSAEWSRCRPAWSADSCWRRAACLLSATWTPVCYYNTPFFSRMHSDPG